MTRASPTPADGRPDSRGARPDARPESRGARADARREAILDRAEALFTVHGFHGASLAAIAADAGLGNAGLLHYFPAKQKLYREVLRRLGADLDGVLAEALSETADTRGRLETLVRVLATWSLQRQGRARLMIRELLDNVDRVERAHTLPLAAFVATCVELVRAAQADGLVDPAEPLVVLARVFGTLAYAQLARPTFTKIAGGKLLADERRWMAAVVQDLERSVFA